MPATLLEDLQEEETLAVAKLSKDLRTASANVSLQEARYLVDLYYLMQAFKTSPIPAL